MNKETEPASEAKELKPCPFCESKAEWINETLPDGHYYIRCPHCHIVMKEDRRDKAIGMWNRREEITRLKAELDKSKDELQLAKFDYKAMFDEVKRLRSLLSEFEKMKAELERERELRSYVMNELHYIFNSAIRNGWDLVALKCKQMFEKAKN